MMSKKQSTKVQKHRNLRTATVAILAISALGMAACSSGSTVEATSTATGGDAQSTVTVGAVQDLSGGLEIYGQQQLEATKIALKAINDAGGAGGAILTLSDKNTQSQDALNVQYTRDLVQTEKVSVVVGALTSSSREAMRPLFAGGEALYFYPALYEGGVCDVNTIVTGPSASQQIKPLVEYALENLGSRYYIIAPDYNFGSISTTWFEKYITDGGGEVVGSELVPLDVSNYSSTISKLQAARPDVVVWLPVGAAQTGFAAQFAAAGLKDQMTLISTNYGSGNQQLAISPEAGEGIIAALDYVPEIDSPANQEFKAAWDAEFGSGANEIHETGANTWIAWKLWAEAANKAASTDPAAVLEALQTGISIDTPAGRVTFDPKTNHLIRPMYIVRGNATNGFDIIETFDAVVPEYEQSVCNLLEDPTVKTQFVPEG
jgi:branched-chain amino acid transport system substrate-binding protein